MKKRHKPVQGQASALPADPPGALLRALPKWRLTFPAGLSTEQRFHSDGRRNLFRCSRRRPLRWGRR
jgi:hypothetical protein